MRKNNRAARAARFLAQSVHVVCQITTRNFIFKVLTTTRARSSTSFTLCLNMKAIRAEQGKVPVAYFTQRDQHEIIT